MAVVAAYFLTTFIYHILGRSNFWSGGNLILGVGWRRYLSYLCFPIPWWKISLESWFAVMLLNGVSWVVDSVISSLSASIAAS